MQRVMKIYLAGPDVFLPNAVEIGGEKKVLCARYGFEGLFPMDNSVDQNSGQASKSIFEGNISLLNEADAIIANLTPFRGPSADVGTVFELGFMFARGKRCLGYSNVADTYLEKVNKAGLADSTTPGFDAFSMEIENFNLADNLMQIEALRSHGFDLVVEDVPLGVRFTDLTAFVECLKYLKSSTGEDK